MSPPVRLAEAFPQAAVVGEALAARGLTLAVAESCTGGLLGAVITAVPGSSAWMRGGVIAYANDVKVSILGVDRHVLDRDGAVSESVALQMAKAVQQSFGADVGVAITGVAGPSADGTTKAVGLVYICVAGETAILRRRLGEDSGREANRESAVRAALDLIVELTRTH